MGLSIIQFIERIEKAIFVRLTEWIGRWVAIAFLVLGILFLWIHSKHKQQKESSSNNVKTF